VTETPDKKTGDQKPKPKGREATVALVVTVLAVIIVLLIIGTNAGWLTASPRVSNGESPVVTPNEPPEIVAIIASTDKIVPLAVVSITCEAFDPDDDELTYTWTCSDGEITGDGPQVEWVAPRSEGLPRIFVTVDDGRGGTAEESLALRVRENRPPEIPVMQSRVDEGVGWVVPGAAVYVWCEAEDPDGDDLTYQWSATEGDIFGQGSAVIWLAPDELGMQWITVRVSDPYGEEVTRAIPVTVSAAKPPEIDGFTVRADHSLLKRDSDSVWLIFHQRSCTIKVLVEDESQQYTYEWSAEAGTITANGPEAVWQAPYTREWVTVAVEISDTHGNSTADAIRFWVTQCPSCF